MDSYNVCGAHFPRYSFCGSCASLAESAFLSSLVRGVMFLAAILVCSPLPISQMMLLGYLRGSLFGQEPGDVIDRN